MSAFVLCRAEPGRERSVTVWPGAAERHPAASSRSTPTEPDRDAPGCLAAARFGQPPAQRCPTPQKGAPFQQRQPRARWAMKSPLPPAHFHEYIVHCRTTSGLCFCAPDCLAAIIWCLFDRSPKAAGLGLVFPMQKRTCMHGDWCTGGDSGVSSHAQSQAACCRRGLQLHQRSG